jgi:hypothetical protein
MSLRTLLEDLAAAFAKEAAWIDQWDPFADKPVPAVADEAPVDTADDAEPTTDPAPAVAVEPEPLPSLEPAVTAVTADPAPLDPPPAPVDESAPVDPPAEVAADPVAVEPPAELPSLPAVTDAAVVVSEPVVTPVADVTPATAAE